MEEHRDRTFKTNSEGETEGSGMMGHGEKWRRNYADPGNGSEVSKEGDGGVEE